MSEATGSAVLPIPRPADAVLWTRSGAVTALGDIAETTPEAFTATCVDLCKTGARIAAMTILPGASDLVAVLADDGRNQLALLRTRLPESRAIPALTALLPQAQAFERELAETHGLRPEGHPWLKPLRRHAELDPTAPPHAFFRVEGAGIHEVAVGPVHAGIIEPGHFRFQCHGEKVLHLEIQLGYQHRGAEALLAAATPARRLVVAESIAGDTTIGHGLAHCEVLEAFVGAEIPLAAEELRGIALELERLANHVGDLGALCNDVGYLPGAAFLGRLRGEFLNLLMELSGNRYGRGLLCAGGVRFTLDAAQRKDFLARLAQAEHDLEAVCALVFDVPSIASRFEGTGVVPRDVAEELGLVGPVGRASGIDRDVRRDHPTGIYRFAHIPSATVETGDVMARALVRRLEAMRSLVFVREQLGELAGGKLCSNPPSALIPHALAVVLVEGWRGEIVHLAVTDAAGRLAAYKVVDPSFHNWLGLAVALRGNQISDFPLCNKSFNLSYAGHDL